MTTTVTARHAPAPAHAPAASPFAAAYGTAPKKDLDAMAAFLSKNWNVKADPKSAAAAQTAIESLVKKNGFDPVRFQELTPGKAGSPAETVTRAVYAYGVLAGERYALSQEKNQISLINRLREIKSKPPLEGLKEVEALDFGAALDALTKALGKAGIKAEPKGWAAYKKTADEYDPPGPEAKEFKGRKLHSSLGASIGGFGDTASRASVFYNSVRDRSPMNTVLGSVFRQGMNLGVITLEKPLDNALKRALIDAGMPTTRGPTGSDRFDH